jgi:two-component system response regulator FixJ
MPEMQLLQKPYSVTEDYASIDPHEIQRAFSESRTLERLRRFGQVQIALLTPREFEVLRRVTSGNPNKTIARQLNISVKTVEKYRGSMMKKLRVRTVPDLMRIWLQAHPQELTSCDVNSHQLCDCQDEFAHENREPTM